MLQTLLVSAGRILTWIEEQLSSSVPSAGKAHLGPRSAPQLSPGWTRHSLALSAAISWGLGPLALGTAGLGAPRVSQGCRARAVPALHHTYSAWPAAFPVPAKQPCSWEEFGCFLMPSFILGFTEICFLSLSFIPTPSSHNTPQLPTPPFAYPSPLHCSSPASSVDGQIWLLVLWAAIFLLATIRGCQSRPDQAEPAAGAGCTGSSSAPLRVGVVSEGKHRSWQWQETRRRETEDNLGVRERTEEWKNVVRAKDIKTEDWAGWEI